MRRRPTNPLIAALDTADLAELERLARLLAPHVGVLKVGLQAFTALGRPAVEAATAHAPVFLDLKLHDIPNTVAGAAEAVAKFGVDMVTVHASGGRAMIAAAAEAAPNVQILAVTVLTSLDTHELRAVGQPPASQQAPRLAAMAVDAGASGLVCAATDVEAVRAEVGDRCGIVVPGIRPSEPDATDDQARVSTPKAAWAAGADYLVVGRPLTRASDPVAAVQAILSELEDCPA